ncbi:hypothetical protein LCGC14_2867930 [marine sediment metagenome]|uniref:Response regulatory domain-containing protein n=1 Tax=marine sediment metagenome TaxID=412755 RepID=A0A0F9AUY6_9ZZZZ
MKKSDVVVQNFSPGAMERLGLGYEVLKASNGQEALRLLFDQRPDLVLLDVVMPGMDGWQTCQRIREIADVPIIMLTGKQKAEEDIVRGLDYGADEYLINNHFRAKK